MSTKTINITYWIITRLFSAFIIFSSIGGITLEPQADALMHDHLGYPHYLGAIEKSSISK
ncbi:MAG: hypothetical protein ABI373_02885 [Flavobacteriales bacterium]